MRIANVLKALAAIVVIGCSINTAHAQTRILATGDSITRRSGLCNNGSTWDSCWDYGPGPDINSVSYANYLNAATLYQVASTNNSGRSGDTCQDVSPAGYTYSGPIAGNEPITGLLSQVESRIKNRSESVVSILIGANDVNFNYADPNNRPNNLANTFGAPYPVNYSYLKSCLVSLIDSITATTPTYVGKKVIMMTYPRYSVNIWGNTNTDVFLNQAQSINPAIIDAVAIHNAAHPDRQALLADTQNAYQPGSSTTTDGVHPSVIGAFMLAREWKRKVCGAGYVSC